MKKKVIAGAWSTLLILGGAVAAGASKNGSRADDSIHFEDKSRNGQAQVNTVTTGSGQKVEIETEHGQTVIKTKTVDSPSSPSSTSNDGMITKEEAAAIAAKSADGTVKEIEKEMEHGVVQYKVEVETHSGETKVRIEAETGKVVAVEHDDEKREDEKHSGTEDGSHHNRHGGDDDKK
jgi:uncharacterized membrane protein YkoI